MATIPVNNPLAGEEVTITKLDLSGGPHAFTFVDSKQLLIVENGEVGSLTVNILGDGVVTANCSGLEPINVSAGYDFVIPAGDTISLYTSTRRGYLGASGNAVVATVTGATGLSLGWIQE
jgi:hypothetical protein